jgi:hypothetical protein
MRPHARSPEELDALLEDAFVLRDPVELAELFEDGAVLATRRRQALGHDAIGEVVAALWACDRTYVGAVRRVLRTRELALVVAAAGIHLARRADDGTWRTAISVLDLDDATTKEEP